MQFDKLLNLAEEFVSESPTPGEKRGDYENTKLMKKKMSPQDAKKAGSDVLKKIVARGGAAAASASKELAARDEKTPEKGSDDPADDPKNKEQEAEDDKETKDTEEPKDGEETKDDEEPKDGEETKDGEESDEVDLTPEQAKKNETDFKDASDSAMSDVMGELGIKDDDSGESDTEEPPEDSDKKALKYKKDAEKAKRNKELGEKIKEKMGEFAETKAGKALLAFMEAEPSPFPGMEDSKANTLSKIKDMLDKGLDGWIEKQGEKETESGEKSDAAQKKRDDITDFKKKHDGDLDEIEKVLRNPDASDEDKAQAQQSIKEIEQLQKKVAKLAKKDPEGSKDKINNATYDSEYDRELAVKQWEKTTGEKFKSDDDAGSDEDKPNTDSPDTDSPNTDSPETEEPKDDEGGEEEPKTDDPASDEKDDEDKPNTEDPSKDDKEEPNTEDPSKKKKKKTEEGYKNLQSTILEMQEQPARVEYKNLHNMIREISNGRS